MDVAIHQGIAGSTSNLAVGTRLLCLLLLGASSLSGAEAARSSEARAAMGAIKDRLVARYDAAGVMDSTWDLAKLGFWPTEFDGSYYDASNFGIHVESRHPPIVLIVCRAHFDYQLDNCARVDLTTRTVSYMEAPAPAGIGNSIWPERRHFDSRLQTELDVQRRREWIWPVVVSFLFVSVCFGTRTSARVQRRAAAWPTSIAMGLLAAGLGAAGVNCWFSLVGFGPRDAANPWLPGAIAVTSYAATTAALLLFVLAPRGYSTTREGRP